MNFLSGLKQMMTGKPMGSCSSVGGFYPDSSCGMNDSLFGCNSLSATGGMEIFQSGCNCNNVNAYGLPQNGNIKPLMQMVGMMFGMACGCRGLEMINFMNNWSRMCDNMGLNTMQGLTNAYQKSQMQKMSGMRSMNGLGTFGSMSGMYPAQNYGPYLGATNEGARLAQIAGCVGGQNGTCGKCLKGVNDSLQAAYGFRLSYPSAYMAKQSLDRMGDRFQNVTNQYRPASKLSSLPPGAIVVWDKKEGHPHGHISIALGNGQEASDHVQKQITGYGSSYTVYMPRDGSCPA